MAKAGRKIIKLTDREKELAYEYVRTSGLNKEALSAVMKIAKSTLYDILKRDKDFQTQIRKAKSTFRSNLVKQARPEFLLERLFRKEFFLPQMFEAELLTRIEKLEEALLSKEEVESNGEPKTNNVTT